MSHAGFSWSDEQPGAAPPMQGKNSFAWSDEQESAPEKKGNAPGTITGNVATMSAGSAPAKPFQRFQGPAIERAASQFGEDLNDPKNFLPSASSLLGVPGQVYGMAKEGVNEWQHRNDPQPDPAETVGHLGVPILSGLVTHAADAIGNPVEAAPARPEPAWKTAPSQGTEVPSTLNRQPYAQSPRIAKPPEAAPGAAGSMVQSVAAPESAPLQAPPARPIGELLNDSLDGKLPDGHIPIKGSSALKSYKYDPATKEFEAATSGGTYIHGDVSPEQVQAFENAKSKGQAWSELKKDSPLVGKVVNGQRVNVKPPSGLHSASPDDLTPILKESVARAKAARIAQPAQ